jgi:catechol-2,3-dioxygenase
VPHLDAIVIHCRQPAALAGFYAKVLGLPVAPADVAAIEAGTLGPDESVLLGSRDALHVWLTPVRALEPVPGRVHLDVRLDVDGDLDRLIALGATRQWEGPKGGWTVLADPEGNLSVPCIRSSDASRRATPDRAGQSPCNRGPASPTGVSNQDQN